MDANDLLTMGLGLTAPWKQGILLGQQSVRHPDAQAATSHVVILRECISSSPAPTSSAITFHTHLLVRDIVQGK